ncbi:MAG: hypothetical protein WKF84_08825 [Pyrinomonadaceae bacterium]
MIVFNNDTKPAGIEFELAGTRFQDNAQLVDSLAMNRFGALVKDLQITGGKVKLEMPARTAAIFTVR